MAEKDNDSGEKSLARQVLADNLLALMRADGYAEDKSGVSLREWALSKTLPDGKTTLHPVNVRRILKKLNGSSVESIQNLADALGKAPWELLVPGMVPPIPGLSPKATELARLYDSIEDKSERRRAYAIARLALTGQIPDEDDLPDAESERPEPETAPKPKPVRTR